MIFIYPINLEKSLNFLNSGEYVLNKNLLKVAVMLYIISALGVFNLQPHSVLAATPSDQLFDGKSLSGVNSLVLEGIRYTTNNNTDSLYNGICVGGYDAFCLNYGSANRLYYSGHALTNDFSFSIAPTFFQISSEDLVNNFKISSMYYIATDDGTGHKINIEGYDGDTLIAGTYGVDMGTSGTYGTGTQTITLANDINSQSDAEYGGLLTFGSGWTNIDTIRITNNNDGGTVYAVIDSLDFLHNVGTDGRTVDLSLWNYSSNDNYYTLTGYKGGIYDGKIEGSVPAIINGLPVKAMYYTFEDCTGLTQAPEIPESVTDMYSTFSGCTGLTQAPEIPDSVTDMSSTFSGCTGLTQAPEIPYGVTDLSCTFYGCKGLTRAPEIPQGVTNMSYTFYDCIGLTQAPEIPDSVKDLRGTFWGCTGLTQTPKIPEGVTNMGTTFSGCTGLTQAPKIPDSVTNMWYTFAHCTGLTQAPEIPDSVTNMEGTFDGCTGLTQAPEIPDSVTNMSYTFKDCTGLTQVPEIPDSVTEISCTFVYCTGLTRAPKISEGVTYMSMTFYGCTGLTQAPKIPDSVTNMSYTFCGCTGLTQAPEIPNSVTNMSYTFSCCTALTGNVYIPDSVTNLYNIFENTSKPINMVYSSKNKAAGEYSAPNNVTKTVY